METVHGAKVPYAAATATATSTTAASAVCTCALGMLAWGGWLID